MIIIIIIGLDFFFFYRLEVLIFSMNMNEIIRNFFYQKANDPIIAEIKESTILYY